MDRPCRPPREQRIQLDNEPWYWPNISREEAEKKLAGLPDGSFLIRDSSVPGELTLTVRYNGAGRSVRVNKENGRYGLLPGDLPFSSLADLVQFYRTHSLASFNRRLNVYLKGAVCGSQVSEVTQYGVFKELYDLSQEMLKAQTRLDILKTQHSNLGKTVAMCRLMLPALQIVKQMYCDQIMLQTNADTNISDGEAKAAYIRQLSGTCQGTPDYPDVEKNGGEELEKDEMEKQCVRSLSHEEEKSLAVNTRLIASRHSEVQDRLHTVQSRLDVQSVKDQELMTDMKCVEAYLMQMEDRHEELMRQMMLIGTDREFLTQVLEPRVGTSEFDRSMWLLNCNRDETVAKLNGLPPGAFLLRRKDKRHFPYVLSIMVEAANGKPEIQHCYVVRPHRRGFGFNAALAVFESIDQLVLRHRYVSLKHYFHDIDAPLAFPVGCQEMLNRRSSLKDADDSLSDPLYVNTSVLFGNDSESQSGKVVGETTANTRDIDLMKSLEEVKPDVNEYVKGDEEMKMETESDILSTVDEKSVSVSDVDKDKISDAESPDGDESDGIYVNTVFGTAACMPVNQSVATVDGMLTSTSAISTDTEKTAEMESSHETESHNTDVVYETFTVNIINVAKNSEVKSAGTLSDVNDDDAYVSFVFKPVDRKLESGRDNENEKPHKEISDKTPAHHNCSNFLDNAYDKTHNAEVRDNPLPYTNVWVTDKVSQEATSHAFLVHDTETMLTAAAHHVSSEGNHVIGCAHEGWTNSNSSGLAKVSADITTGLNQAIGASMEPTGDDEVSKLDIEENFPSEAVMEEEESVKSSVHVSDLVTFFETIAPHTEGKTTEVSIHVQHAKVKFPAAIVSDEESPIGKFTVETHAKTVSFDAASTGSEELSMNAQPVSKPHPKPRNLKPVSKGQSDSKNDTKESHDTTFATNVPLVNKAEAASPDVMEEVNAQMETLDLERASKELSPSEEVSEKEHDEVKTKDTDFELKENEGEKTITEEEKDVPHSQLETSTTDVKLAYSKVQNTCTSIEDEKESQSEGSGCEPANREVENTSTEVEPELHTYTKAPSGNSDDKAEGSKEQDSETVDEQEPQPESESEASEPVSKEESSGEVTSSDVTGETGSVDSVATNKVQEADTEETNAETASPQSVKAVSKSRPVDDVACMTPLSPSSSNLMTIIEEEKSCDEDTEEIFISENNTDLMAAEISGNIPKVKVRSRSLDIVVTDTAMQVNVEMNAQSSRESMAPVFASFHLDGDDSDYIDV